MEAKDITLVEKLVKAEERGRKAGIKEVVEWIPQLINQIKEQMWKDDWGIKGVIYPDQLDSLVKKALKAKLKEWGL